MAEQDPDRINLDKVNYLNLAKDYHILAVEASYVNEEVWAKFFSKYSRDLKLKWQRLSRKRKIDAVECLEGWKRLVEGMKLKWRRGQDDNRTEEEKDMWSSNYQPTIADGEELAKAIDDDMVGACALIGDECSSYLTEMAKHINDNWVHFDEVNRRAALAVIRMAGPLLERAELINKENEGSSTCH